MKSFFLLFALSFSTTAFASNVVKTIWFCESKTLSVAVIERAPYHDVVFLTKSTDKYVRISPDYTVNSSIGGFYLVSSGQNYENGNWESYLASLQVKPDFTGDANWIIGSTATNIQGMTCVQNAVISIINP